MSSRIRSSGWVALVLACSALTVACASGRAASNAGGSPASSPSASGGARSIAESSMSVRSSMPSIRSQTAPPPLPMDSCRPATLRVSRGPRVSPATGERSLQFAVTAASPPCTILGYPKVTLLTATGSPEPFTYALGRGEYITDRRPRPVAVGGGEVAYFKVAQYSCDGVGGNEVMGMNVQLPGQGFSQPLPARWIRGTYAYCTGPSKPDPADIIEVSTFESAPALVI